MAVCVRVKVSEPEGESVTFDPSESERGILLLVQLSEVAIPSNGVRFHLCNVEMPSTDLVKDAGLILSCLPDAAAFPRIHVSERHGNLG